jgi:hypothetical protein
MMWHVSSEGSFSLFFFFFVEEDELENINLLELQKAKEFQERKRKKPIYDVYGDLDSGKKSILAQYDEKPERAVPPLPPPNTRTTHARHTRHTPRHGNRTQRSHHRLTPAIVTESN